MLIGHPVNTLKEYLLWSVMKIRPISLSQQTITLKVADQGRSDLDVVLTMSLCELELKQTLIS